LVLGFGSSFLTGFAAARVAFFAGEATFLDADALPVVFFEGFEARELLVALGDIETP